MKKKALIVVNLAGFLHFLWNDIATLQEMGYEVSVAMNENSAAGPNLIEIPKLEEMGIAHYQVEFDTKSPVSTQNIQAYKQLKLILKTNKYDLIHCHTPIVGILTRMAARKYRKTGTTVIYTNVLTTSQYGTVDLITTISTVAGPMLTLNIAESVMRFGLDKDADKEKNTQCGSIVLLIAMIIGLVLIPICRCITEVSDYAMYVYFYVISLSASQLFLCDLRGKELLLKYSLGNILQTLMIAILNITFLLVFKMETGGYLLAYIIANFIVAIYAIIAGKGYKAFSFHNIDRCKLKEMIRYSVVLIPNTFMWWIMNSSDRVMVTYMIGAAANGIYAVSYKLPTLVSTLTGIFNQAWSYSAIREEGTSDETEYNNKMFKTLSAIAFMMGIGLLLLTKPFLGVYVADSYYDAWKYTPFLIIGCVYLTLGTFMATSYTVHKDSFGYLFSGSFGAAFNILLNFILIPVIGVYGAALATCISYIAVFMFRVFHTRKYIKYDIMYKEFILGSLLMLVSAILMFVDGMKGFLLQLVILLIGFTVFSKTWIPMLQFFLNKIQRKRVS